MVVGFARKLVTLNKTLLACDLEENGTKQLFHHLTQLLSLPCFSRSRLPPPSQSQHINKGKSLLLVAHVCNIKWFEFGHGEFLRRRKVKGTEDDEVRS